MDTTHGTFWTSRVKNCFKTFGTGANVTTRYWTCVCICIHANAAVWFFWEVTAGAILFALPLCFFKLGKFTTECCQAGVQVNFFLFHFHHFSERRDMSDHALFSNAAFNASRVFSKRSRCTARCCSQSRIASVVKLSIILNSVRAGQGRVEV